MTARKWKTEFLVNSAVLGDQTAPAVAALGNGGFAIAWADAQTGGTVAQLYDAAGNRSGVAISLLAAAGGGINPALAGLAGGGFWTAQFGGGGFTGEVRSATGAYVRDQGAVSAGGPAAPSLASLGANGGVLAWTDLLSTSGDIYMQGFNADGSSRFATVIVNSDSFGTLANAQLAQGVSANPAGSKFAVVWQDTGVAHDDIRFSVFDSFGTSQANELPVNLTPTSFLRDPVVAWLDNETFAIAWTQVHPAVTQGGDGSGSSIKVKIFDALGQEVIVERVANNTRAGDQSAPALAALPNGGFVIAWQDMSQSGADGSLASIRLQAFNSWGDKAGGEILVNTTTQNAQSGPAVTALADGRVLVTWTDSSQSGGDTSGAAIRAQIVDPRDGVVDGTGGNDTLHGHDAGGDIIGGYDGLDLLHGLAGNDQIYGGEGNDTLFAGKGDDSGFGGEGSDTLLGDLGDDDLFGEGGSDLLRGGLGADMLDGGAGTDTANYANATASVTVALDSAFAVTGEASGDTFVSIEGLVGSNFADILRGDAAVNTLQGLGGADDLRGGGGIDSLVGGLSADILRGEAGSDRFYYNATNEGGDSVADFTNIVGNDDGFYFKRSVFLGGGAQLPAGTLAAANFVIRAADNQPQDANDTFIFQTDTRQLWYDATGNATAGDQILISTLQAGATMTNVDVILF